MKITIEKNANGHTIKTDIYPSGVVVEYIDGSMHARKIHGKQSFKAYMNNIVEQINM